MNSAIPNRNDPLQGIALDDRYAYILVEYNQKTMSVSKLRGLIELTGSQILEIQEFQPGQVRMKTVLFKLDTQDVREIILSLSNHPLQNVTGYNSKQ